ncbi:L,D-transpeptidase [Actinokineospora cianjurensis]|uniref:L,D-transpeptidase-like protein n=1 Tax=Actinokineospora cianjurensis TaxID=585224 RepID=A0A421B1X3_9PSEU|nr:L,D-transpeptidase [Actinokineospora cianjurensis]RLK58357.1 L,D-transpeptidase-like protein [Actinokineospora cianjurensis]
MNEEDRLGQDDAVTGSRPAAPDSAPAADRAGRRPGPPVIAALVAVVAVLVGLVVILSSTTRERPSVSAPARTRAGAVALVDSATIAPRPVSADQLAALPIATTFGTTANASRDPAPDQVPSGLVAHPTTTVAVFAEPGGEPVAAVPAGQPIGLAPRQSLSDTWLPVFDQRPGWALVGLPSRPNGSVAWLHIDRSIQLRVSPFLVTVDRAGFTLTLARDGARVGQWPVGTGKTGSPTPAGRTFLLAALRDTESTFSEFVLPLGAHSDTHQIYGGGPGTIGVHTWPSAAVYGEASSDGCVRVPPDALRILVGVPLGTPVLIK